MRKVSIKQAFWLPRFARLELSDRQGCGVSSDSADVKR